MKKKIAMILVLVMTLSVLCTACGGGNEKKAEESATPEPAATEIPSVTAPPAEGDDDQAAGLAADDNSAPEMVDRGDWLASLSEKQRKVEEELIGGTVEDLYAAIGEPSSAEYTTSCLVADGEDGLLKYDDFYVSTTRMANGEEYVMGTTN